MAMDKQVIRANHTERDEESDRGEAMPHGKISDEEAAKIVRSIFEWKVNGGLGNLAICHRLNDMGVLNPTGYKKNKLKQNYNNSKILQEDYSWCSSTVRNILKNDMTAEQQSRLDLFMQMLKNA